MSAGTDWGMGLGQRVGGFLELTRPGNALAAGVLTFTGAFVVPTGSLTAKAVNVALAVAATVLAVGAGNAINDYFDRDIDRINRPDRAIPRGAVTPREALAFSVVLFVAAVACALLLPTLAIVIAFVNLVALVAYTQLFKGLPGVGNVVVAYLTGSTFLFGGTAVASGTRQFGTVLLLAVLAGVATLTREIVKDVEDIDGDRAEGLRTLPITVGERRSLAFGAVVMAAAVVASAIPFVAGIFGLSYLAVVIPADALMLGAALYAFVDPGQGQRLLKGGMFLAAGAFVIGRIAILVGN